MSRIQKKLCLLLAFMFATGVLGAQERSNSKEVPIAVLLIGNSQMGNEGVDKILEQIAASATPSIGLKATEALLDGATLRTVWNYLQKNRRTLEKGPYDYVVFQDTLGFTIVGRDTAAEFVEYAGKIDDWTRKQGGKTVFYMEQTRTPLLESELSIAQREQIHSSLAKRLNADVAPIGIAWQRIWKERPTLGLYAADNIHPSIAGSYLISCVLYATIFKRSPIGLFYPAKGFGPTPNSWTQG